MARLRNFTPHIITLLRANGTELDLPIEGRIRVEQENQPVGSIQGVPCYHPRYGRITGIPDDLAPGDLLLVSAVVLSAAREDVHPALLYLGAPDTGPGARRDPSGKITGVRGILVGAISA